MNSPVEYRVEVIFMVSHVKKILVVDDEEKIVDFVASYLENSGYDVYRAYTGNDALEIFQSNKISLILLDLMLPDINGEEICKTIRKVSKIPIIMLTAKIEEENILKGLAIGADDYITKPFSPRQLVARVEAILRRVDGEYFKDPNMLSFCNGKLIINPSSYEVLKNNQPVNLTPSEYKILLALAKRPSKVFTREELINHAFEDEFIGFDRTVDSHIKNLRYKLETDPKHCKYILTIRGIGYKFGGE